MNEEQYFKFNEHNENLVISIGSHQVNKKENSEEFAIVNKIVEKMLNVFSDECYGELSNIETRRRMFIITGISHMIFKRIFLCGISFTSLGGKDIAVEAFMKLYEGALKVLEEEKDIMQATLKRAYDVSHEKQE